MAQRIKGKHSFIRAWFLVPLFLMMFSFYPVQEVVRRAKFREEWARVKYGINNIADNSLTLHEIYGNEGGYLRSNQTVHIVHLFNPDGLWIAQYSPELVMLSNPGFNHFSRFNPMAYSEVVEAIQKDPRKIPSGEFKLKFSPDDKSTRDVHCYFRWVYHRHEATGEECDYLIVVASSFEALDTIVDPSVASVYLACLMGVLLAFAVAVLMNYSHDMRGIKKAGEGQ